MLGYYQMESMPNSVMSMPGLASTSVSVSAVAPGGGGRATAGLETMRSVNSLVCIPDVMTMFDTPAGCEGAKTTNSASPTLANCPVKYQCQSCPRSFTQKSSYQTHVRSHTDRKVNEDPHRCEICAKTFAVPARLKRHFRTHTGEKPYQCEYCHKSFSVKENLSVHRRIHTKERPYKCDRCGRAFEHSGKLHRHMRIHTGERPHKCSVCGKTFIQSGQLVIHMRTHTGEKPYVCEACNKGFTCSKQLKVHTRTHTGEKPYTCEICSKAFGYNHVLKLHQVSHYGEKVYKCTLCHETFNSKKNMELHIKKHPESPTSLASSINDGGGGTLSPSTPVGSPIEPDIEISQGNGVGGSSLGIAATTNTTTNTTTTTDDKQENRMKTEEAYPDSTTSPYAVQRNSAYYLYSGNNREQQQYSQPATATATATPSVNTGDDTGVLADIDEKRYQASVVVSTPLEPATHHNHHHNHHVFFYPEPSYPSYSLTPTPSVDLDIAECSPLLNLPGNDARRRVEAALEAVEEERQRQEYDDFVEIVKLDRDPLLTPPSSNPESPVSSPDLALDLAIPPRETLILPPRKRSKMILQSMESEYRSSGGLIAASQRQNSVIQFARAS